MKILNIIIAVFLVFFLSCGDSPKRGEPVLDEGYEPTAIENTTATTPPANTPEPAQNTEGVWHYTCPNGCAGGAGAAGPCPVCGETLAHNSGYHNTTNNTTVNTGANNTTITTNGTTTPDIQTTPVATPEPAQNDAGVWHYTCPNGCAGGGGSASPCGVCGTTLVHNTGYHN